MKKKLLFSVFLSLPLFCFSQQVAVKTNILYWSTTTPNLSLEWASSYKVSVHLQGNYNGWDHLGSKETNRKLRHWLVQPEVRFWIYEAFDGHFLGVHTFYGDYNISNLNLPLGIFKGLKDHRYQGYGAGLGFSYGYHWYMGHHWNLEFEFGFGWAYLSYDRYDCRRCSPRLDKNHTHYFGPTKLGLSVVYLFGSKKR